MRSVPVAAALLAGLAAAADPPAAATQPPQSVARRFLRDFKADYREFSRPRRLGALWCGLAAAGAAAHTPADEGVRDWYQASVRSGGTDQAAAVVKQIGNGWIAVPVFAGAGLLDAAGENVGPRGAVGRWGWRSLRTLAVGAPVAGALQWTLGSSRPLEGIGSEWHPFADNNGVSAHAFVGAIPFLSAAAGVRNRAAKSALLLVSTLCGLSRINDDMHYVSQAGLGWWIAWLSASAVERTDRSPGSATVFPVAGRDLAGMGVGWRF